MGFLAWPKKSLVQQKTSSSFVKPGPASDMFSALVMGGDL